MAKAKDDDSISVTVDDSDTIQVAVDTTKGEAVPENQVAVEDPKPKVARKRVNPTPDPVVDSPTPEQALEEAKAYAKQQEEARRAAETTAAAERSRADAAERARQQALKDSEDSAQRAANSEITLIESSIASAQRELESQQDAYTRAAEAGEFAKMAQIQVKISKAASALDRLEDAKSAIENNPRPTQPVAAEPAPVSTTEKFLSTFSPKAQNWLRQHMDCLPPQYGGDAVKNNKMMQGHYAAAAQDLEEGSSEYFRVIEEHINPKPQAAAPAPAAGSAASPAPAAPVSRSSPAADGTTPPRNVREVRLTRDQQEMAKVSFPHLPEQQAYGMYARNLLELEAEGKLGRTSH